MAPINLAAFTNIANNSELKRLEVSTEGTGIVAGAKAFSKGNTSRNMAVRQAFTNALTSEFGRNAQIPLGFRAGRSPLSAKTVQKIVVSSQQAEAKAIKNVVMASLKRMGNLYPASLSNKDAKAALDKEMGILLNKALEGKDAKQYLDPKKADDLVTTFKHHITNTKPELVFVANILASGKVDAQWVDENRPQLSELIHFYAEDANAGINRRDFNTLCETPKESLTQMHLVHEAMPRFSERLKGEMDISLVGLDAKPALYLKRALRASTPQNATEVTNAHVNDAVKNVKNYISSLSTTKVMEAMSTKLKAAGFDADYGNRKKLISDFLQANGLTFLTFTSAHNNLLHAFAQEHYPAMEFRASLKQSLAAPMNVNANVNTALAQVEAKVLEQRLPHLEPRPYSRQELHTHIRAEVDKLPEGDVKTTLRNIVDSRGRDYALTALEKQLKESMGLVDIPGRLCNLYDIKIKETSSGKVVLHDNPDSVVMKAINSAMEAITKANPDKLEFTNDDMKTAQAHVLQYVEQNGPEWFAPSIRMHIEA